MNVPLRMIGVDTPRTENDVTNSSNLVAIGLGALFVLALVL